MNPGHQSSTVNASKHTVAVSHHGKRNCAEKIFEIGMAFCSLFLVLDAGIGKLEDQRMQYCGETFRSSAMHQRTRLYFVIPNIV